VPVVLLPPSEGKAAGGEGPVWAEAPRAFPALDRDRRRVIAALRRALGDTARAERLLGVRGAQLRAAVADDRAVHRAPTLPALERYAGVVWTALDPGTLAGEAARRARDDIVVVSGLWGALAGEDAIPAYRLKMAASLPGLGPLARLWRPRLDRVLGPRLRGAVVYDLLPQEHAAAFDAGAHAPATRVRLRVEQEARRGDAVVRTVVGHDAKAVKGRLARWLLEGEVEDPAALAGFAALGYELDAAASSLAGREALAVLVRPLPNAAVAR
jgi:cytoplasmic iron level regulating protein YaaA (DUF328/UPF0246 family)